MYSMYPSVWNACDLRIISPNTGRRTTLYSPLVFRVTAVLFLSVRRPSFQHADEQLSNPRWRRSNRHPFLPYVGEDEYSRSRPSRRCSHGQAQDAEMLAESIVIPFKGILHADLPSNSFCRIGAASHPADLTKASASHHEELSCRIPRANKPEGICSRRIPRA